MTLRILSILLISSFAFSSFSMDVVPYWDSLEVALRVKIVAYCGVENRKNLLRVNRELSQTGLCAVAQYFPAYLTRREHIRCLVQSAQDGQAQVLKNVIAHASLCDHEDVLDWLPIFVKLSHKPPRCFLDEKLSHNGRRWISRQQQQNARLSSLIQKRRKLTPIVGKTDLKPLA